MKYTITAAVDALERANPVPDPQALADAVSRASVSLVIERNREMDTDERVSDQRSTHARKRGSLMAVAVFVAVILVGGAALLTWTDSSQEVGTAGMDDREIVDAFVEARGAGDVDMTTALIAEDAHIDDDGQTPDHAAYLDMVAWLGALEWNWELLDCDERAITESANLFSCGYRHDNAWGRALGHDPFNDQGTMEFIVEDGQITSFTHNWSNTTFSKMVWEVFGGWVQLNHPDLVDDILSDGCCTAIRTSAAVEIWRDLTEKYVAELKA